MLNFLLLFGVCTKICYHADNKSNFLNTLLLFFTFVGIVFSYALIKFKLKKINWISIALLCYLGRKSLVRTTIEKQSDTFDYCETLYKKKSINLYATRLEKKLRFFCCSRPTPIWKRLITKTVP